MARRAMGLLASSTTTLMGSDPVEAAAAGPKGEVQEPKLPCDTILASPPFPRPAAPEKRAVTRAVGVRVGLADAGGVVGATVE